MINEKILINFVNSKGGFGKMNRKNWIEHENLQKKAEKDCLHAEVAVRNMAAIKEEKASMKNLLYVIDFETTGLSPNQGARATEVAIVKVVDGEIVDKFQSLINPNQTIPLKIITLTGITQEMVDSAPSSKSVMLKIKKFVGNATLFAHNASFDQKFLENEMSLAGLTSANQFLCTIKIAKKIYPRSPRYALGSLLEYADIPLAGNLHRALADATATALLLVKMQSDIQAKFSKPVETISRLEAFISSQKI
jgi:DNA polymerase III subunit epsilon